MEEVQKNASHGSMSRIVVASLAGSTVAGIVFGVIMHMMGMVGMISSMVGSESLAVGWLIHIMISWIFGLGYGAMTFLSKSFYVLGIIHGVLIWLIGPIIVMPVMMGMGPMFTQMFAPDQLMSLVTHLMFSLILAFIFKKMILGKN
ncbi:hypothetical protein [Alteribacillus bidgolensis]|uniref:DUF1440 domain-containing protein n=1 Tax=Alteribacillus bidgolensis TaxID=930129 RepID=A0A1G8CWP3_9BACI|nr:hypothetical protein [Alteribacillus bidgolensis]SDH49390.1 hypothetical protein SAMN05216352_101457 [Alteribacillus bidgolensis]